MAAVAHPHLDAPEFLALQNDAGWRLPIELIGGEAVVTPPTGGDASSVQGDLFHALRGWQESDTGAGLTLQDVFIRFPDDQFLAPDIAWWAQDRLPAMRAGALDVIPDLVVEVLSPATRANDLGAKRLAYLTSGVRELWLADPEMAMLTLVHPGAGDEILDRDQRLETPLLTGFGLDLQQVFAR